jgi:hypothetical protein
MNQTQYAQDTTGAAGGDWITPPPAPMAGGSQTAWRPPTDATGPSQAPWGQQGHLAARPQDTYAQGSDLYGQPAAKGSFFSGLPCPTCGSKMTWRSLNSMSTARWFGLAGFLFVFPWTAKYECPQHGLIDERTLPPPHKSIATLRKVVMTLCGFACVALAIWLIQLLA